MSIRLHISLVSDRLTVHGGWMTSLADTHLDHCLNQMYFFGLLNYACMLGKRTLVLSTVLYWQSLGGATTCLHGRLNSLSACQLPNTLFFRIVLTVVFICHFFNVTGQSSVTMY